VTGWAFDTVLVANRGEIARRVIRTARRLGLRTVAVYSTADAAAPHVREADEAILIGKAKPQDSYLNGFGILSAAKSAGAGAIHPGYGFLSENAGFARQAEEAGLAFVGPTPAHLEAFGAKHTARELARAAGVPLMAGTGLLAPPLTPSPRPGRSASPSWSRRPAAGAASACGPVTTRPRSPTRSPGSSG
jgi:urea carboxylase